jgi:hypothetical protein
MHCTATAAAGDLRTSLEMTGLDDSGFGLGVCAADYNNDGFVDLYLTNFGPKRAVPE